MSIKALLKTGLARVLIMMVAVAVMLLPGAVEGAAQGWAQIYNSPDNGDDGANAVAVDGSGNVYVTGYITNGAGNNDYATIKYNSAGTGQWIRKYDGLGHLGDVANDIAIDGSGNVYVTGFSTNAADNSDFATIKYSSAGTVLWVRRYNGPANDDDRAKDVAVDGSGNVYVTGSSCDAAGNGDYATIKYNSSGVIQWVRRYNGPGNKWDSAYAITVDGSGNVYVTGSSDRVYFVSGDYATIKYDSSGARQWVRRYGGVFSNWGCAIAVDGTGNVYVAGTSWRNANDYTTIKYNSAGTRQWLRNYNGPGNNQDDAADMVMDGAGNVYVTGWSTGVTGNGDYATVKYNSAGTRLWVRRYNGPGDDYDEATAIALDGSGNVYVTGFHSNMADNYDCATVKYSSAGALRWVMSYEGPDHLDDSSNDIAVDGGGNVYLTGCSTNAAWNGDIVTIKYTP